MKTIEEAAKDHALYKEGVLYKDKAIKHFKAGVEFAQRWIPTTEETPSYIGKEIYILTKNEVDGCIKDIALVLIDCHEDIDDIKSYFTHWRPVELY